MELDDEICLCFHVSLRKLLNFAIRNKPAHASQMSDCLGAGTGCGWCRATLAQIAQARDAEFRPAGAAEAYQAARAEYRARRAAEPPPNE